MKFLIIYYFLLTKFQELYLKSPKRLAQYHQKKFNQLKKQVLSHSPFYQPYLSKSLSEFPIINKQILMTNFNQINTLGMDKEKAISIATKAEYTRNFSPTWRNITVGLSSGTSGNRGLFLVSKRESAYWVGSLMAKLFDFPIKKQQRIALFLRSNSNLYSSLNRSKKIIFSYFDITQDFNYLISKLKEFDPTLLAAPPSVLMHLLQCLEQRLPSLDRIFSVAEVLDLEDRYKLEQGFQCPVAQIYQASEGFLAITHRHINKLLFNEDNLIIEKEWIDKDRYIPIITDLRRRSLPIIRYRLDDVIVQDNHHHIFSSISQIEGREGDICYAIDKQQKIAPVFSDVLRHAIVRTRVNYSDYRIMQLNLSTFSLSFTPELNQDNKSQIESSLTKVFKDNQHKIPAWQWHDWQTIEKGQKRRKILGLNKSFVKNST